MSQALQRVRRVIGASAALLVGAALAASPHPSAHGQGPQLGGAATEQDFAAAAAAAAAPKLDPSPPQQGPYVTLVRTGRLAAEPRLGVDRQGRVFFNAIDYVTVPPDTEQGALLQTTLRSRVLRIVDGVVTEVTPRLAGAADDHVTQDPYLFVDEPTGRVFQADWQPPCNRLSFSDDAGATWTSQVVGCEMADHATLFAGPPVTSRPNGYPRVVYLCAITGGALAASSTATQCDKSLDGGSTFLPTGALPFPPRVSAGSSSLEYCDGPSGHGVTGPDGTLYLPRGWCGQPYLAISRDEGASWSRVQVAHLGMARGLSGEPDHEAAVAVDATGGLYYAWAAHDRQLYLVTSRDAGRTWSEPVRVSAPGTRQAALASIAVGDPGKVVISYLASSDAPPAPFPDEGSCRATDPLAYLTCPIPEAYSHATWGGMFSVAYDALRRPRFTTVPVSPNGDPLVRGRCGPPRCEQAFDFHAVVIDRRTGEAYASFVDACPPEGACAALGEGVVAVLHGTPRLVADR